MESMVLRKREGMYNIGIIAPEGKLTDAQKDKLRDALSTWSSRSVFSLTSDPQVVVVVSEKTFTVPLPEVDAEDVIRLSEIVLVFPSTDPISDELNVSVRFMREEIRTPNIIVFPDGRVDFDFSAFPDPSWLREAQKQKKSGAVEQKQFVRKSRVPVKARPIKVSNAERKDREERKAKSHEVRYNRWLMKQAMSIPVPFFCMD